MEQDAETRQILRNLEAEVCLEGDIEEEFWRRLARQPAPKDSKEAKQQARTATRDDPALTFKRQQIPAESFAELTRYGMPEKLTEVFPGLDLKFHGLSKDGLNTASSDDLEALVGEANDITEMGMEGVVWVAESSPDLDKAKSQPANMMKRLGLPWLVDQLEQTEKPCVEYRYDRAALPTASTLHVPSSLDGVDFAPFRPNPDCSASSGMTHPLDSGVGPGFPEAVHGSCKIGKFSITLIVP